MKSVALILSLFCVSYLYGQTYEEFTDSRDGKTYKTIVVEIPLDGGISVKRTWMAENLNYKINDSFCYQNESAYCEVFGRLYTFRAAIAACPEGWHVPTIDDWKALFRTFGGNQKAGQALQKDGASGINLALGGFGDSSGVFKNVGISGNYWDAEKKSNSTSGLISVRKGNNEIYHSEIGNWLRNSCRCMKDYE